MWVGGGTNPPAEIAAVSVPKAPIDLVAVGKAPPAVHPDPFHSSVAVVSDGEAGPGSPPKANPAVDVPAVPAKDLPSDNGD